MAAKSNGSGRDSSQKQAFLIVNPAEFRENILQCQICMCNYDKSERRPKTLTCGHIFCLSCLKQIFDQGKGSIRNTLKCPTCRDETLITKGIKDLTPAFHTEHMMEIMATTETVNLCSKHQGQTLNFYCLKCSVPVCRDCTVVDHRESDNHNVTDLSKVLASKLNQFKKLKKESEDITEKLRTRSQYLENALTNLDKNEEVVIKTVDKNFEQYITTVKNRQMNLKTDILDLTDHARYKIERENDHVKKLISDFKNECDIICATGKSEDIKKITTMNEQLEALKKRFRIEADKDDTELSQSFSVSFGCDAMVSSLENFGKLTIDQDSQMKVFRKDSSANDLNDSGNHNPNRLNLQRTSKMPLCYNMMCRSYYQTQTDFQISDRARIHANQQIETENLLYLTRTPTVTVQLPFK